MNERIPAICRDAQINPLSKDVLTGSKAIMKKNLRPTPVFPSHRGYILALALALPMLAHAQGNSPVTGSMLQETPEQRTRMERAARQAEADRVARQQAEQAALQARQRAAELQAQQEAAQQQALQQAQQRERQEALARAQQQQAQREAQLRAQQQAQAQRTAAGTRAAAGSSIVRQVPSAAQAAPRTPPAAQTPMLSAPASPAAPTVVTVTAPNTEPSRTSPQATATPVPAAAAAAAPSAPTEQPVAHGRLMGDVSSAVLRLQAEGRSAAPAIPTLGATASASWKRYVDSFSHSIPEFYETTSQPKGQ